MRINLNTEQRSLATRIEAHPHATIEDLSRNADTGEYRVVVRDARLDTESLYRGADLRALLCSALDDLVAEYGERLDCGHAPSRETGGYADTQDGKRICYACADASERAYMRTHDRITAYVDDGAHVITWSGGKLARVTYHGTARNGFGRSMVHSWRAVDDDGATWYGRNAGPHMVINLRKAKSR